MPRGPTKLQQARRARVDVILPILKTTYPDARCSLDFRTPLELLVATILSAQCTDARVNQVTPGLFRKYPSAAALDAAPVEDLERDIQSTGFYRNKAKSLKGMARALVADHAGEVPRTMDELTALAGVGRKTANVLLGNAFDTNVGVTVDTHVGRLSLRLGLTRHEDAVKVEADLIPLVPQADRALWSHLLIYHGRAICTARKPNCPACPLLAHCPSGPSLIAAGSAKAVGA